MTSDLFWLGLTLLATALLPFPYVLNRIFVRGLAGTLANPRPDDPPLAAWAQRAQRAHANAVENLVVFAPAVLAVHVLQRGDEVTATACAAYFFARLIHYLVYALGVPGLRTLAYFAAWAAIVTLVCRTLGVL